MAYGHQYRLANSFFSCFPDGRPYGHRTKKEILMSEIPEILFRGDIAWLNSAHLQYTSDLSCLRHFIWLKAWYFSSPLTNDFNNMFNDHVSYIKFGCLLESFPARYATSCNWSRARR